MSGWHHFSVSHRPGFFGHKTSVRNIVITPNQRYLLSNCQLSYKIWNLQSGELVRSYNYSSYEKTGGLAITPDSRYAIVGYGAYESNQFRLIDLEDWSIRFVSDDPNLSTQKIAITPDSRYAIIGYDNSDFSLRVYDLQTLQIIGNLAGHGIRNSRDKLHGREWVKGISITQDGRYVISGALDNIKVWDFQKHSTKQAEVHHLQDTSEVWVMALTPDDNYVLSANMDNEIKIWDWYSGELRAVISNAHGRRIDNIAITPDARYAVTCSLGGSVKVWELPSGKLERTLPSEASSVDRIAITPDGRWAIFAMYTDIRIWIL